MSYFLFFNFKNGIKSESFLAENLASQPREVEGPRVAKM